MRPNVSIHRSTCVLLKPLCLFLTPTVAFGKRYFPTVAIKGHLRRLSTSVIACKCFKISSIQKCGSSAHHESQSNTPFDSQKSSAQHPPIIAPEENDKKKHRPFSTHPNPSPNAISPKTSKATNHSVRSTPPSLPPNPDPPIFPTNPSITPCTNPSCSPNALVENAAVKFFFLRAWTLGSRSEPTQAVVKPDP